MHTTLEWLALQVVATRQSASAACMSAVGLPWWWCGVGVRRRTRDAVHKVRMAQEHSTALKGVPNPAGAGVW